MSGGAHIFQKSRSHLKILHSRKVTRSSYHNDDIQILGTTVQNLVATTNWRPEFLHPWCKPVTWPQLSVVTPITRDNSLTAPLVHAVGYVATTIGSYPITRDNSLTAILKDSVPRYYFCTVKKGSSVGRCSGDRGEWPQCLPLSKITKFKKKIHLLNFLLWGGGVQQFIFYIKYEFFNQFCCLGWPCHSSFLGALQTTCLHKGKDLFTSE